MESLFFFGNNVTKSMKTLKVLLIMLSFVHTTARRQLAFSSSSILKPIGRSVHASNIINGKESLRCMSVLMTTSKPSHHNRSYRQSTSMMATMATSNDNAERVILPSYVTQTKFSDQENLSIHTKNAIEKVLKIEKMTEIQLKTMKPVLSGKVILPGKLVFLF